MPGRHTLLLVLLLSLMPLAGAEHYFPPEGWQEAPDPLASPHAVPGGEVSIFGGQAPNSLNTLDDNNGSLRVSANVDGYLEFDWDGNGSDEDPYGIATFGIYRGDDRIIFWREVRN